MGPKRLKKRAAEVTTRISSRTFSHVAKLCGSASVAERRLIYEPTHDTRSGVRCARATRLDRAPPGDVKKLSTFCLSCLSLHNKRAESLVRSRPNVFRILKTWIGSRSQLGPTDKEVHSSSARVSLPRPVQPLLIELSYCLVRSSFPTFLKAIGQLSPLGRFLFR